VDARLVTLKLFLAELGVPSVIDTVDDRKRVQKAVYLGQLTGVNLGYRFGWYLMGPYSPPLTKDYYDLAERLDAGDDEYQDQILHPSIKTRLQSIKPLFDVPADTGLAPEEWLELLASYHYLRSVRRATDEQTQATLNEQKPRVAPFTGQAAARLSALKLLPGS
jgi:uncharacterized protein YwgA